MSERPENFDLNDLESALRELRPRPEAMDRAALMYRAGRASARGWTVLAATVALGLGIALWIRPAPSIVYVAVPQAQNDAVSDSPPSPPPDDSQRQAWSQYIHLQEQVSLHGLDGLPSPSQETEKQPPDGESLLNSL
jgi:hypothetical protein